MVGFNTFLTNHERTMAHELRASGYLTAFIGKYHLGFPIRKAERRGLATFSGTGRGYSYEELRSVVREMSGFEHVRATPSLSSERDVIETHCVPLAACAG